MNSVDERNYKSIIVHVLSLIKKGDLKPGKSLPGERVLAEQFGVGRTTVRVALKFLEFMGIVEINVGKGAFISSSLGNLAFIHLIDLMGIVKDNPFKDLFDTRMIIETKMAALAALNAREEDIGAMDQALEEMEKDINFRGHGVAGTNDFHLAVYKASKNIILYKIGIMLHSLMHESREITLSVPGRSMQSLNEHRGILAAIKKRDSQLAGQLMEEHLSQVGGVHFSAGTMSTEVKKRSKDMPYQLLFSQAGIGNIKLKNRFIMAPMGTNFGQENTALSERQLNYYTRRAKGGVGLIITESAPVVPGGMHGKNRIQVWRDDALPRLRKLTEAAHENDCAIVLQLTHAGAKSSPALIGEYPVAPSSVVIAKKDYIPRELSVPEIRELIEEFARAAELGMQAGFDGIEILAASGHLVHQFLSPVTNKRNDDYGGALENRMNFLMEIIRRIKAATVNRLPVLVKIYGRDPENPDGTAVQNDEWQEIVERLDAEGVASFHFSTNYSIDPRADLKKLLQLTASFKPRIKAKISVAGSILTPDQGEAILEADAADFIEIGRATFADPELPNKARDGRSEDIRPCLNCNRCRVELNLKHPVQCAVNPYLGREDCMIDEPAAISTEKKVVIVGAGPAGLQAAICLAERGYRGTVYEKETRPGGLLWSASAAPGKERMTLFLRYLIGQFEKTGFKLEANKAIDPSDLTRLDRADAVIIACGALPYLPEQVGINSPNVYFAVDVLAQKKTLPGNVVVLGGGQAGCEAADYLSENKNSQVTIMCSSPSVAKNVYSYERNPLLKRLGAKEVKILVNASPTAFDGAVLSYRHMDEVKAMDCNALVIAKGWKPNSGLQDLLDRKAVKSVFRIGDALQPQSLLEALRAGLDTALKIKG